MDAVLATIGTTGEDAGNIRVTIQSYNGGTPKVGMVRIRTKKDGSETFRRLGRMNVAEALAVVPLLTAASMHPAFEGASMPKPKAKPAPKPKAKPKPKTKPKAKAKPAPKVEAAEVSPSDVVATMDAEDLQELASDLGIHDWQRLSVARLREAVADAL
jgi:hypothetical protein